MTEQDLVEEIKQLHQMMAKGAKEIHRLVDLWSATQLRVALLEKKLRQKKKP